MHKLKALASAGAVIIAAIYLGNSSWVSVWVSGPPSGEISLLAHRAVHQTYHREGLTNKTCTAERIDPPRHSFIENTIPSMRAAIEAGADMIELDIKLTNDGEIVVFHDETLDCRTDGTGKTHHQSLAYLQSLDIGYGYTPDNGKTYPFRGQFVGDMPSLGELLTTFPDTRFLVNLKHSKASEGEIYLNYLSSHDVKRLGFVGAERAAAPVRVAYPDMIIQTRQSVKNCLKGYALSGWSGRMPESCHNNYIPVPSNYRHFLWGWPHRFEKRLNKVGSRSMLVGPFDGHGIAGIDDIEQLDIIPENYTGIIYTNKIDVIGPALAAN